MATLLPSHSESSKIQDIPGNLTQLWKIVILSWENPLFLWPFSATITVVLGLRNSQPLRPLTSTALGTAFRRAPEGLDPPLQSRRALVNYMNSLT